MSNFIRVTVDGEEYALNVNYIVRVTNYADGNHAIIIMAHEQSSWEVDQSYDEIMKLLSVIG